MPCGQPRPKSVHVHYTVVSMRTVCAPLILCALTSPARSYATRCFLLPPRSGEACKARHATWGCVQSQAATAGALLELRPLANACLCEARGRQTRGSFDFCGPAEEQHSWTCDCTPRRPSTVPANASSRSWTWSVRCRSCSTFRAPSPHRPGTAGGQEAHTRGILPFGKTPSRGPRPLRLAPRVLKSVKNPERFGLDSILKCGYLRCNRPT